MAQQTPAPILELSTLAPERPKVRIDGVEWEIAVQTDFGLVAGNHLKRLHKPMSDYLTTVDDNPTDEVVDAMVAALSSFTLLVVRDATPELVASLTENQQLSIVEVFTSAAGWTTSPEVETSPTPPTPAKPTRRRSTSATSSQGSSGSTGTKTG